VRYIVKKTAVGGKLGESWGNEWPQARFSKFVLVWESSRAEGSV
jgi:hypothetical protein